MPRTAVKLIGHFGNKPFFAIQALPFLLSLEVGVVDMIVNVRPTF